MEESLRESRAPVVFTVSDGTGETAVSIVRAVRVQFENADVQTERYNLVRTPEVLEKLLLRAREKNATIVATLVSHELRVFLMFRSMQLGVKVIDVLFPLLETLSEQLGRRPSSIPGLLRQLDNEYFRRIFAIEYTVRHDDAQSLHDLNEADIVLAGISRTSKTPLSMYLGHKGYKVANIPMVVGQEPPRELFEIDQNRIIGLIIDPERLSEIRTARMVEIGADFGGNYADARRIYAEIEWATEIFKRNRKWPVLDVTAKAIEENAVEIERIILTRFPELANIGI